MFKEMESFRCKTQNKQVKYSDLTFTLLSGTFLQNDLIGDSRLESNKICLSGDGFSISSPAALFRTEVQTCNLGPPVAASRIGGIHCNNLPFSGINSHILYA